MSPPSAGRCGALACLAALTLIPGAAARGPLVTAIRADEAFSGPDAALAFSRTHAAGATAVRIELSWTAAEPRRAVANARDPTDASYDWQRFDRLLAGAVSHGLEPIAVVNGTPSWARRNPGAVSSAPNVRDFANFAAAAAARYSGRTPGVPRVRWWQLWNEPNVSVHFSPQFSEGRAVSPLLYRSLVNVFAASVHAANASNLVIAGGLSPFTVATSTVRTVGPMPFMRRLLCMSAGSHPRPTCSARLHFDVWSHHPYTSGGPTHRAFRSDDVSLGDLPRMKALLVAAVRAGHIVSRAPVRFWVTEFSWDTNPPDPLAVPLRLQARWTAEALYRMWSIGIDLVTWNQLRDGPYPSQPVQSGLYFRGRSLATDRPKLTLTAFRFPFVAYRRARGLFVWGRTPWGKPGSVAVEAGRGGAWRRLASLRANRYGIFSATLASRVKQGYVRARLLPNGGSTLPFSLHQPPDRFVRPFG